MRKRILLAMLLMICCLIMSGCGDQVKTAIVNDIRTRAALNIELIAKMRSNGLLDELSAQELQKGIEKISNDACNSLEKDAKEALTPYVSWYKPGSQITNHFFPGHSEPEVYVSNPKALEIVTADYKDKLADMLDYDVYELADDTDLNEVKALIDAAKSAIANNDTAKQQSIFSTLAQPNKYFKKTGKLLSEEEKKQLIKETTLNKDGAIGQSELGQDFKVRDPDLSGQVVMTIRLLEFNEKIINKLIDVNGWAKDTYLRDNFNKRIYVLTYPVWVVSDLMLDNSDPTRFTTSFYKTNYFINLYNNVFSEDKHGTKELRQTEKIIKVTSSVNGPDQSSFVVKDGKVVLRDYLELTYLPGVVEGEKWVSLGRRVRVQIFDGRLTDDYARLLNRKGEVIENIPALKVTDILSVASNHENISPTAKGKAIKLGTGTDNSNTSDSNDDNDNNEVGSINLLQVSYQNMISPTIPFGSDIIAKNDRDSIGKNGKMYLRGLCTAQNPFQSQLYKYWIEGNDEEYGNLQWWNSWLTANGFFYQIDANGLTNALIDNYQFEMREAGYIIIDGRVVRYIQNLYDKEDKEARVTGVRTAFTILGIALMAYGVLLIASWAFDVNVVSGPKLLTTLTFGHWEAIQDSSELPNISISNKSYMTFSKTLTNSLKIIAVGFLLTIVDIVEIVVFLLDTFGTIADVISKVIFGNK